MVAEPARTLNVIGSPEEAVALIVKEGSPKVLGETGRKVIV